MTSPASPGRAALGALLFVVALRLAGLGLLPLWDPSEGRYVAISQTMAESSDWITPRFPDGTAFIGKPPLYFWTTAASLKLLGPTEFAARLSSAVAAVVMLGATLAVGVRTSGTYTGRVAALLAATSVFGLGFSALALTDMMLAACVSLALAAFATACVGERHARGSAAGHLFFGAIGLAMLAKGPVGVLLCAMTIGLWSTFERDLGWVRRLPWISGTLLFFAVWVPWYAASEIQTPGFLRYFLLHENLLRFLTVDYGDRFGGSHAHPYGFAWVLLGLGLLPWSLALVPFALTFPSWRQRRMHWSSSDRFLLAWALAAPLFFAISRNVMLSYLLPSLPGFALLAAKFIVASPGSSAVRRALLITGVSTIAAVSLAALVAWARSWIADLDAVWLGLMLPVVGIALLGKLRSSAEKLITATALLWAISDFGIRALIREEAEPRVSTSHVAAEIQRRPDLARCEVIFFGRMPYSAWFYLPRRAEALRESIPKLEVHLADGRCHVFIFRDRDLPFTGPRLPQELLCSHGAYEAFVDRGPGA